MAGRGKPIRQSDNPADARSGETEGRRGNHPLAPFLAMVGASLPWLVYDSLIKSPEEFWTFRGSSCWPPCQRGSSSWGLPGTGAAAYPIGMGEIDNESPFAALTRFAGRTGKERTAHVAHPDGMRPRSSPFMKGGRGGFSCSLVPRPEHRRWRGRPQAQASA